MPFIGKGITLNHYLESGGDAEHYKKILKQVVENLFNAFVKTGFVHCDLHFGNILIDDDGNPLPISDRVKKRYEERIRQFGRGLLSFEELESFNKS